MHPRNRYKEKNADFLQLSRLYPQLQTYIMQRSADVGTIDFSNPKAVKELTKALLAHDFDLKWDVSEGHLVPTIPLRLNYLHWIEDLLSEYEGLVPKGQDVVGLDIGVGASCIYPLLGANMNKWKFYGTEIEDNSLRNAIENIQMNSFNDTIQLSKPSDDKLFLTLMESEWRDVKFSFLMCNPPFFASIDEKEDPGNRTTSRPTNITSQQECKLQECVTEGGEFAFVKKIIEESLELRGRFTWFTAMLGKRCHLNMLMKVLQAEGVPKIAETEFVQGKTRRWGIGWSFDLHFRSWVPLTTPFLQKPLFLQVVDTTSQIPDKLDNVVVDKLTGLLDMEVEVYERKMLFTAYKDTWSNQRKRRRSEKLNRELVEETIEGETEETRIGVKRKLKESEEVIEPKTVKVGSEDIEGETEETRIGVKRKLKESEEVIEPKTVKVGSEDIEEDDCLIEFFVEVKRGSEIEKKEFRKGLKGDGTYLRFEAIETRNKEYLHQIMQFVKNNIAT